VLLLLGTSGPANQRQIGVRPSSQWENNIETMGLQNNGSLIFGTKGHPVQWDVFLDYLASGIRWHGTFPGGLEEGGRSQKVI